MVRHQSERHERRDHREHHALTLLVGERLDRRQQRLMNRVERAVTAIETGRVHDHVLVG